MILVLSTEQGSKIQCEKAVVDHYGNWLANQNYAACAVVFRLGFISNFFETEGRQVALQFKVCINISTTFVWYGAEQFNSGKEETFLNNSGILQPAFYKISQKLLFRARRKVFLDRLRNTFTYYVATTPSLDEILNPQINYKRYVMDTAASKWNNEVEKD